MAREEKNLKLNFLMNAFLTASSFIFPLISFPYISRVLLPEGTGRVNFAVSVAAYFNMFAQLGIPTYGIKACASCRDDREELSRTAGELLTLHLITAAVSYSVLLISVLLVPRFSADKPLFLITGLTVFFSCIGIEWLYQGVEEYAWITVRSVVFKALAVFFMFLLVHEKKDYVVYAAISVFASAASGVLNLFHSRRFIERVPLRKLEIRRHLRPVLIFFALACTATIYTNLDNVMLGFMKDDAEVGLYSTAVKIKTILVSLITSLGAVLLPRASYYVQKGETERFRDITKKALGFVIFSAVPVTLYFIFFAKEGIRFIAGPAYRGSVFPMQIIMPTLFLIGITNIFGMEIMVPTGREKLVLVSTACGAVTDLVVNAALIPYFGAAGAAAGTLLAELSVLIVQAFFLRRELPFLLDGNGFLRTVVTASLALLPALIVRRTGLSAFPVLLLSAAVYFSVYALLNLKTVLFFIRLKK